MSTDGTEGLLTGHEWSTLAKLPHPSELELGDPMRDLLIIIERLMDRLDAALADRTEDQ